jgi:hypothetical protein
MLSRIRRCPEPVGERTPEERSDPLRGGFIMVAVLSFNVIGDGLRDALDPRAAMR